MRLRTVGERLWEVKVKGGSACALAVASGSATGLDMPKAKATRATIAAIPKRMSRGNNGGIAFLPPDRHLLRAKDLADARYSEPLTVDDMAHAAGLSRAHFSREFRKAFGESPHAYLLTRRLERAAALLRATDRQVADICFSVGLQSVGSFTTSFTRTFGMSPVAYRETFPPAAHQARVQMCVTRVYGRPQRRTFREDSTRAQS
jgi:AraC-like DNA-binding protein